MSISISSNFRLKTSKPLDDRLEAADLTVRDAIPAIERYEGMLVYVKATGVYYSLIGGVSNLNWVTMALAAQTLTYNSANGDLAISGGNTINLATLRIIPQGTFQIFKKIGNTNLNLIQTGDIRIGFGDSTTFVWQQWNGSTWDDLNSIIVS